MATVVTRTIKPAGGGDYTTLAAWATARAKDCVAADVIEQAECYSGGNLGTGSINFDTASWLMDSTRYAEIVVASGHSHSGVWDQNKAYFACSSATAISAGSNGKNFVRIKRLQISSNGDASSTIAGLTTGSGGMLIDACLIKTVHATGYGGFSDTGIVQNSIFYNFANPSVGAARLWGNGVARNCTFINCGRGVQSAGAATVQNCLAQGCADGFYGTFSAASDYNCSDIAGDAPGAHSVTGTVQFKDAANKDFHLAATDTVARGAGVNLTASGITTDIDGETRPATGAWDIGADQYAAAVTERNPWGKKPWGRNPWNRARWKAAA